MAALKKIRVSGLRRMARDASARDKTLTRVVTMCIEEYFGDRG